MSKAAAKSSCCAPSAGREPSGVVPVLMTSRGTPDLGLRDIPGGKTFVGTKDPYFLVDEEGPPRPKTLKPFRMMETAVTNAQFAAFVEETGYKTEAERYGWSFVFFHHVADAVPATRGVESLEWWRRVDGADWLRINGPGSEADWHPDHPVVQVSWNDARAFARWAGGRLPSEAEWEHAARGGLGDIPFPWGTEEPNDTDRFPCNIWQGSFPHQNTGADGYATTSPAKSFTPNGYGLYNMVGNVWEWIADPLKVRSLSKKIRQNARQEPGAKLLKGGSFLCHKSYCFRYRIPARTSNTPDSTTTHQGFRLAFDAAR